MLIFGPAYLWHFTVVPKNSNCAQFLPKGGAERSDRAQASRIINKSTLSTELDNPVLKNQSGTFFESTFCRFLIILSTGRSFVFCLSPDYPSFQEENGTQRMSHLWKDHASKKYNLEMGFGVSFESSRKRTKLRLSALRKTGPEDSKRQTPSKIDSQNIRRQRSVEMSLLLIFDNTERTHSKPHSDPLRQSAGPIRLPNLRCSA